jgi:N-formylglutamate amidohydrolase
MGRLLNRGAIAPFHSVYPLVRVVGVTGIEPVTPSMSTKCSPAELYARKAKGRQSDPSRWASIGGVETRFKRFYTRTCLVIGCCKEGTFVTDTNYDLSLPQKVTNPVVFSSPHSGCEYPAAFVKSSILSKTHLRSSEDAFVDDLFAGVVDYGSPLLSARAPRAYVDLNRAADELDPSIIEGAKNPYNNPRIASGLGVIPRVVSEGRQIQNGKLTMDQALARIEHSYHPYHDLLAELLVQAKRRFGLAVLIDCHSMPSDALQNAMAPGGLRPDIVLGNRYGASAGRDIFRLVETAFKNQGFVVGRNTPFAGGHITQKYGTPSKGQHVVQVEINRALYMHEGRIVRNMRFGNIKTRLAKASQEICDKVLPELRLAAE